MPDQVISSDDRGPRIEGRPLVENVLRGEVEIAPLIRCKRVLARLDGFDELRAIGLALAMPPPRVLRGRVGSDLITRSMLAIEIRSPASSSSLMQLRMTCSFPRSQNGSWPCPTSL